VGSTRLSRSFHKLPEDSSYSKENEKVMRWIIAFRIVIALLSRMYLGVVIGLASWAILPLILGWTPTIVMSGSMLPNIEIGDVVVAQDLTPEQKNEITTGQVLLARDPSHADQLVTHRVVNVIEGSGFITKGDANPKSDPTLVPIANVLGIERLRIPMIGIPIQSLRSGDAKPLIFFMGITSVAQLLVMNEKRKQKIEKNTKESLIQNRLHRTIPSRQGKVLSRAISSAVIYSLVTAISVASASSAANFYGNIENASNIFSANGKFNLAPYKNTVIADSPFAYYRLNDTSSKSDTEDLAGGGKKSRYSSSGVIYGVEGALLSDPGNKAVTLDGASGNITNTGNVSGPRNVTLEIWFKTTTGKGGILVGFESVGNNGADRVLYMTSAGQIMFGIDKATKKTIHSNASFNDGKWHMATATLSGLNAALYIDGELVSSGSTTSAPTTANGDWSIGGGAFSGWDNHPSSNYFAGSIDEVGIYNKVLTPAQILTHYNAA
jgi:signal peptidase I